MAELPILPLAEAKALGEGLRLYGWMTLSRELDEVLCAANPRWFPSAGEEATMVGAFCDLRPDDAIAQFAEAQAKGYAEFCRHYGFTLLPTRPRTPRS